MSEAPAQLEKKQRNWIMGLLKLVFIVSAFVLVGITVLSNMGGSNESLKDSVEGFISSTFQNRPTTVDKLVHMSFFPRLGFDAEGISILSKPENGYKIVEIGKLRMFMGFWNVAMRKPRVLQFYLKDFRAIKGTMGPKEFYIEKIFIDHDTENQTAKLRGNGKIGDSPWIFSIPLGVIGSKGSYNFIFSKKGGFTFDLADISSKGIFVNHEDGYLKFENFSIKYKDRDVGGDVVISALGRQLMKLKANIKSQGTEEATKLDVIFDYANSPTKVEGNMVSSSSSSYAQESVLEILLRVREIIGYDAAKEDPDNYDLSALFDFSNVKILDKLEQTQ